MIWPTYGEVAQLMLGTAAVFTVGWTFWREQGNRKILLEVKHATNSLLDARVDAAEAVGNVAGRAQERAENKNR